MKETEKVQAAQEQEAKAEEKRLREEDKKQKAEQEKLKKEEEKQRKAAEKQQKSEEKRQKAEEKKQQKAEADRQKAEEKKRQKAEADRQKAEEKKQQKAQDAQISSAEKPAEGRRTSAPKKDRASEGKAVRKTGPARKTADRKGSSGAKKGIKEKSRGGRGAGIGVGLSIRVQLIVGFLIPILFCVGIGVISYSKASDGLVENYEKSSMTALEMTMNSFDESMKTISSITMELGQDNNVTSYALGGLDSDSAKQNTTQTMIQNNLNVKQTSSQMIEAIHIIPVATDEIITTKTLDSTTSSDSFITPMAESEDAEMLNDKRIRWGSYHNFIDQNLKTDGYILYCSRCFNSGSLKGLVVTDISRDAVADLLAQLDFGEGSYISFSTAEGAEISTDPEFSIANVEGIDWEKGSDYIKYDGKTYFYMTAESGVNGSRIVALVPKAYITQSSSSIRNITMALVVVACIIAGCLSAFIITGITANIKKSVNRLDKVSQGDLTEQSSRKEKPANNEFGKLDNALSNTVTKMRGLLGTVSEMKDAVQVSGDMVRESGIELGTMTENVSAQIEEIDSIIATQNEEITDCNNQMEELSVQIKGVSDSIFSTIDEMSSSRRMIDEGRETVQEMVSQSEQTADATKEVQEHVVRLADKLGKIVDFVNDIQDIASQTNLLSLNASIEAARAGEQGRGFSVVAEEIRKLADSSDKTATEIQKIIEEISVYSQNALTKVSEAEDISTNQMESAKKTITAFDQMNGLMEGLVSNMQSISQGVDDMNQGRHGALKAIHGISESSEHTVEATGEVNRFLEQQMKSAETLKAETARMQENMKQLEEAVQTFKL